MNPLTVPCNFELPEKLTPCCPALIEAEYKFSDLYDVPFERVSSRIVLAGYVAHLSVWKLNGFTQHSDIVNQHIYKAWLDGKIFCFKKYYVIGEEILTTLNREQYCKHVVDWQKSFKKYVVFSTVENEMMDFDNHDQAFKYIESLKTPVKCLFKNLGKGRLGAINKWGAMSDHRLCNMYGFDRAVI